MGLEHVSRRAVQRAADDANRLLKQMVTVAEAQRLEIVKLRGDVAQVAGEGMAFRGMSAWRRLLWLLRGWRESR